ncbi:nuclear transport factor 2 family protein [Parasphingorhabdus sp.]|uniref:nuclear transport factor 2 family protein n=1 Tax=Parasphingorhabdus sp. TaxID=2709688 RepID=UPI003BAEB8FF
MSQEATNKAIVRRFLGAVESGDVEIIEELQAEQCTWWVLGAGEMSRKAYTDAVKDMLLNASPRKVEIIGIIAEGDIVAAEIRSEMHFGDRTYANEYHDLFVIEDGLIIHGREYFDTSKVQAFFGQQGG